DPGEVHAFYNARRQALLQAHPNPAHLALAQLEAKLMEVGGTVFLCTQNVDDLHERAGSRHVVHMHGELLKARCENCEGVSDWREDMSVASECPHCWRIGGLRPHVVWFGEVPFHLDAINDALREADLFVAIGTSGSVDLPLSFHPAATRASAVSVTP